MHRQQNSSRRVSQNRRTEMDIRESPGQSSRGDRKFSRHSVLGPLPDGSIARLYLVEDNYVMEDNGLRSPKTLAELCTDSLCRSLAYLDGELPPGLPQDVVDIVVASLVKHNAMNATTLRVLKNCELGSLTLAGCRGVSDEWFEALSSSTSFTSTSSPYPSAPQCAHYPTDGYVESMELDDSHRFSTTDVYFNASLDEHGNHTVDESSCSTSSFVSASSNPDALIPTGAPHQGIKTDDVTYKASAQFSSSREHIMKYEASDHPPSITSSMALLDLRGSQRLTDRGLIKLADLNRLEVARLDNCYSIVGRGLLAFSISHRLHTLSLANCRRLTDEAIINISHLNSLEALSLDGCRCLTDRSLAALAGLFRLKKLDVSQCDLITDDGLKALENLEELEELSLGWCRLISDNGLDILTSQYGRSERLRVLSLARCPITDSGAEYLSRLQSLEELDINGCSNIGSHALGRAFSKMTKLTTLDVSYCPGALRSSWQGCIQSLKRLDLCYSAVRDSQLAKLTDLPNLEELNFDSCLVGDWSIAHLADNNVTPNLTSLDLADTEVTDLGMVHLAKFKQLKRLSLFYCNISNGGLRHLAQLTSLEVLNLDSREIGDEGLWHLRNLTRLKSLDIFSGRITDTGCSHISRIKSLESLELCGGGVGDHGCTSLATLENLASLNLSQNERITNRGAAALAALSNLKTLNLSNTRVSSSALIYFRNLMKLQSLALYGCRGMEESKDVDQLQKALPSLKCVRLNDSGSDDDGKIRRPGDTDDESEDDDDDDDDGFEMSHASLYVGAANYDDSQGEEDSEMEDAYSSSNYQPSTNNDSSSSYSDHDY